MDSTYPSSISSRFRASCCRHIIDQVHTTTRQISLTNIQEICSGSQMRDLRVTTPLDELCVTLVMADDQCVSFKFPDVKAREHFATCMKVQLFEA
eukprot:982862-Amphidinium_carterae.1